MQQLPLLNFKQVGSKSRLLPKQFKNYGNISITQVQPMYRLVITSKFKRAFRKFTRRNADLQARIEETIAAMENDIFAVNLGTHKLEGKLSGLLSCSCGYDCRVVFSLKTDEESGEQVVLLLDIGTHDDVY
nr:type II toxin-antitoxin system YafQ family toxin [Nostoc sp. DedQUE07]MDZ8129830.1 type II toxin-antitoxin system YafQ family toxin [Nostoc sp. DedQUE07]